MGKYFAWFIAICKCVLSAMRRGLARRQRAEPVPTQRNDGLEETDWKTRSASLINSFQEFQKELMAWYQAQCMMFELRRRDSEANAWSGFDLVALMLEAFVARMTSRQQSNAWRLSTDTDHELCNMIATLRNRIKSTERLGLSDPAVRSELYERLKDGIIRCQRIFDDGLGG